MESNEVEKSWKRQKVGLLKTQADFILSEVAMRSLSAHSDPCTVLVFPTEGLIYFHPAGSASGIRDRRAVSEQERVHHGPNPLSQQLKGEENSGH